MFENCKQALAIAFMHLALQNLKTCSQDMLGYGVQHLNIVIVALSSSLLTYGSSTMHHVRSTLNKLGQQ